MKTYSIKLSPESTFQSFPSSDTLFGAICWGIKRLYGDERLQEVLKEFDSGSPEYVLSSAFPLLKSKENSDIAFYPKPNNSGLKTKHIEELAKAMHQKDFKKAMVDIVTKYKLFKKGEYLSESLFQSMQNGRSEKSLFDSYCHGDIKPVGHMFMDNIEFKSAVGDDSKKVFNIMTVQKNSIDRLTMSTGGEGQTFYQSEVYTSNIFSLHFLLKTDDIEFLKPIFKYLEDKGIGGNRSTGKGKFMIEVAGEIKVPNGNNVKTFINLSKFIPLNQEIDWKSSKNCYEIFPYRSKVDSEGEFKGEDVWKDKIGRASCRERV